MTDEKDTAGKQKFEPEELKFIKLPDKELEDVNSGIWITGW